MGLVNFGHCSERFISETAKLSIQTDRNNNIGIIYGGRDMQRSLVEF